MEYSRFKEIERDISELIIKWQAQPELQSRMTREELRKIAPTYNGSLERFNPSLYLEKLRVRNPPPRTTVRGERFNIVNEPIWKSDFFANKSAFDIPTNIHLPANFKLCEDEFADIVEDSLDKEDSIDLATMVVEAAHAMPTLCDTFPYDEETSETKVSTKLVKSIEVWSDDAYLGSLYEANATTQPEVEMMVVRKFRKEKARVERTDVIKCKSRGEFKLEQEAAFPISYDGYPHILERITNYLDCDSKFNFKAAFSNVIPDMERESKPTVIRGKAESYLYHRRRCICTTRMYNELNTIRHRGQLCRKIFNQSARLKPRPGPKVRLNIPKTYITHQQVYRLDGLKLRKSVRFKEASEFECLSGSVESVRHAGTLHGTAVYTGT